ncbi:MAG: DUF2141 domain-containing protein, partial [Alphaproteobacteria bacterium]|nr:DUF2141 domain-containing protein [Alphaproteobacteria bacterium]
GNILICVTHDPAHFPNCSTDPKARKDKIATKDAQHMHFADLASGDYAIALIHDENANGTLDVAGGMPSEGVGFSRNPRLFFSAPKFRNCDFLAISGVVSQTIKLRYFL